MTTTDVVDDILEEIIFHCVSGDYSPPDFGTIIVEIISEIVMIPGNSMCQKSWKESEDSMGLVLSDEDEDHQLPCSDDFQFFFNIAKTVPSHSPGSQMTESDIDERERFGPTPPSSFDTGSLPSDYFEEGLSQEKAETEIELTLASSSPVSLTPNEASPISCSTSPGVFLLPTQAPCNTQFPYQNQLISQVFHQTLSSRQRLFQDTTSGKSMEEDVGDSEKLEEEMEDEIKSEAPTGLVHMDSLTVNRNKSHGSSIAQSCLDTNPGHEVDEEEDEDALPLTFNCREDLNKKLRSKNLMTNTSQNSSKCLKRKLNTDGSELNDIESEVKVKKEPVCVSGTSNKCDSVLPSSNSLSISRDEPRCSQSAPDLLLPSTNQMMPPLEGVRPISMIKLLNRPPRIGLSRLEKKLSNLHEVTIVQTEE